MNQIKPLDQVILIGANTHNHAIKVVNKFGSRDSVGRTEIIEFGRHNLKKFRQLGMLKNGVPSEATLCRVEHGIDELALAERMQEFAGLFHRRLYKAEGDKEIICVDGKAERGIVSAYSYNTGITLATEACREKSNEIKAVPRLIDKINISGKIVTADAMSMQKCIIDRIRENGGDFLIELKANRARQNRNQNLSCL